jgi:putative FmdB family regulatory protein
MPTYSYRCSDCTELFELYSSIQEYNPKPRCSLCNSKHTYREYILDISTQSASVKKSDSELKTLGDLAMRNTEKMSSDQKAELYHKHNEYKDNKEEGPSLPSGMSRLKRPPKVNWPGSTGKKRRSKQ